MANQGAKRRAELNKKRITWLTQVILTANVVYLTLRLLVFARSTSWLHYLGFAATGALYLFCYSQLSYSAKPVYADSGELVDGGADLDIGGVASYYQDLIYISAGVQLLSATISDKFWWLFLSVPAFAAYKLWTAVLQPYLFTPRPQERPETDAERKKREKLERKQGKVKYSRGR